MSAETLNHLRTLGFVLAGTLFWLEYWDLKDRRQPESRWRLLFAFLLGMVSAGIALLLYSGLDRLDVPLDPTETPAAAFLVCVGIVGPVEEVSKFLVARFVVFRWRAFDERVDGFVYAATVALGFAAYENFLYLPSLGWGGQIVRTLCAPLVHTLFAALWGWGTAHALHDVRTPGKRFLWQAGSLAVAAFLHGIYDFALYAGAPPPAIAGIVLGLWLAIIVGARRALRLDVGDARRARRSAR